MNCDVLMFYQYADGTANSYFYNDIPLKDINGFVCESNLLIDRLSEEEPTEVLFLVKRRKE